MKTTKLPPFAPNSAFAHTGSETCQYQLQDSRKTSEMATNNRYLNKWWPLLPHCPLLRSAMLAQITKSVGKRWIFEKFWKMAHFCIIGTQIHDLNRYQASIEDSLFWRLPLKKSCGAQSLNLWIINEIYWTKVDGRVETPGVAGTTIYQGLF